MIGIHILLLRGGVPHHSVAQHLSIISPFNASKPIVVWDRDKMRCTGKMRLVGGVREDLAWCGCMLDSKRLTHSEKHSLGQFYNATLG